MSTAPTETAPFTEHSVRHLGPLRGFFVRRPRAADAGLALLFAAWSLLMGLGADSMFSLHSYLGGERVLQMQFASLALTVLGSAALLWRRRRPVAVAAAMAVLGVASLGLTGIVSGFEVGLAIALYTVAARRSTLVAWVTCGVSALILLVSARLLPLANTVGSLAAGVSPEPSLLTSAWYQSAVPVVVLSLLAVSFGISGRASRLHTARFVDAANAVARETESRARLAEAAERARIAREMHDVVAHSLTVMVALGGGASVSMERSPDKARAALDELVATGRSALTDMRRVLGVLGEPGATAQLAPAPGDVDLPVLIDRFRLAGLPVRAAGLGRVSELDAALQLAVYRIVQEALTNVLRHAPATRGAEVDIQSRPGFVDVMVTDHGGATGSMPGGSQRGLIGMRERAAAFGGTVEAGPYGEGWRVRAQLPLATSEEAS